MAVTSFIPQLWSARLIYALEKNHIATAFVNREYEGQIRQQGDTVHINSIGAITIKNYVRNTDMDDPQVLDTTDQQLKITEAKYFNFCVDDVDAVQAAGDLLNTATSRAAYALSDAADAFIFATIAAGAGSKIAAGADAYADVIKLRNALDKANVPQTGRLMAVSPDFYAELLNDGHIVANSDTATGIALNGVVGMVSGMTVLMSNNLGSVKAIASVPNATAYAEQIAQVEADRMEKRFSDLVKGLHLYGAKVIDGTQIATLA